MPFNLSTHLNISVCDKCTKEYSTKNNIPTKNQILGNNKYEQITFYYLIKIFFIFTGESMLTECLFFVINFIYVSRIIVLN